MKLKFLMAAVLSACLLLGGCEQTRRTPPPDENHAGPNSPATEDAQNSESGESPLEEENMESSEQKNVINLSESEKEILSRQAKQLTEQISTFALDASSFYEQPIPYPDDIAIERFIVSIDLFDEQKDYPYTNTHRIEQDGTCYFQKQSIDRMIEEVFHTVTWTPVSMSYDQENQEYFYMTGFGIGNSLECKNIETEFQNDNSNILVSYELWTSPHYPDYHQIGEYQAVFSVCQQEGDSYYLQYLKVEKITGGE